VELNTFSSNYSRNYYQLSELFVLVCDYTVPVDCVSC